MSKYGTYNGLSADGNDVYSCYIPDTDEVLIEMRGQGRIVRQSITRDMCPRAGLGREIWLNDILEMLDTMIRDGVSI